MPHATRKHSTRENLCAHVRRSASNPAEWRGEAIDTRTRAVVLTSNAFTHWAPALQWAREYIADLADLDASDVADERAELVDARIAERDAAQERAEQADIALRSVPALADAIERINARIFPRGYLVVGDPREAPASLADLNATYGRDKRMVVWGGGSDATIWPSARANHAFRAWHDFHHYSLQAPFNASGEAVTCASQCAELRERFGDTREVAQWCAVLDAEVNGQLAYASFHGDAFPSDQAAFVRAYLADKLAAVVRVF